MSRFAATFLLAVLLLPFDTWAQKLPPARLDALRDVAETATAAGSAQSYTAPDPVFTRQAEGRVECKNSKTDVKDEVIERFRAKFRAVEGGGAVLKREPSWNNARLCYYLIAVAYYKI